MEKKERKEEIVLTWSPHRTSRMTTPVLRQRNAMKPRTNYCGKNYEREKEWERENTKWRKKETMLERMEIKTNETINAASISELQASLPFPKNCIDAFVIQGTISYRQQKIRESSKQTRKFESKTWENVISIKIIIHICQAQQAAFLKMPNAFRQFLWALVREQGAYARETSQ